MYSDGTKVQAFGSTVSGNNLTLPGTLTAGAEIETASNPVLNLSQTWNNAGVAFTALKLNVTDTASAAGSLLLDLQVGGASKFNVNKNGQLTTNYGVFNNTLALRTNGAVVTMGAADDSGISRLGAASLAIGNGTAGDFTGSLKLNAVTAGVGSKTAPSYLMGSTAGIYARAGTLINYSDSVTEYFSFTTGGGLLRSNLVWSWSSSTPDAAGGDTGFSRVSAGLLALGNGTASDISGGLQLTRILGSSGVLSLGAADAAAPMAQTFQVQSVVAGTTNTAGADFTINASRGTGTGNGGRFLFKTAPAGSTGSAQNALQTSLIIDQYGSITSAGDITTGSTTLHKTSVALTNGAAAQTATLTNAPAAGNPTKWIPINDNGTTRYIPAW